MSSRVFQPMQRILVNVVAAIYVLPVPVRVMIYRVAGIPVGTWTHIQAWQVIRPGALSFGSGCFVNYGCLFDPGDSSITIMDGVFIGSRAQILAASHHIGRPDKRAGTESSEDVVLGRGVWIGAGVIVLPGVTIADGCVVGAGSVVTRSTEPDGVYVGAPARRIRTLSSVASG